MRRYWLPKEAFLQNEVHIEGSEFKHIFIVCRRGLGDRFEVLQEDHQARLVEVFAIEGKKAICRVLEMRQVPSLPLPFIKLALSVSKPSTMERILEKSVELGVHEVALFSSDFSFSKFKKSDFDAKLRRWNKIIRGATQQSGRGDLMRLTYFSNLDVLLQGCKIGAQGFGIFAYESQGDQSLSKGLEAWTNQFDNFWIFVGSEGGFSDHDVQLFRNHGLLPTTLGDQVLRVETACVTLVSIIKYELGII